MKNQFFKWWHDHFICQWQLTVGDAYPYMSVIAVISNMVALQALVTFFKISQDPLSSYKIKPKFFTVQFTLIITSVQSLVTGSLAKFGVIKCLGPYNPRVQEKCKYGEQVSLIIHFINISMKLLDQMCFHCDGKLLFVGNEGKSMIGIDIL